MNRRGKRTARLAMALGLLVLGGSGIVLWSLGQEYWHIWRLRASEETTRREAAAWLAQNGSERALPDLFERLDELYEPVDFDFDGGALHFELFEPDPTDLAHGSEVVCVLEAILRTRGAAVPGLESRLRSRAPVMRIVASAALQRLGDAAAPAVPALVEALDDKSHNVRLAAVRALGAIGPDASAALPALRRLEGNGPASEVRAADIEKAIEKIEGDYD